MNLINIQTFSHSQPLNLGTLMSDFMIKIPIKMIKHPILMSILNRQHEC